MRYVSEEGRAIVRDAIKHLNNTGIEFMHDHPFFGQDENFPKTVALVKQLAQRISTDEITVEDANQLAEQSMDDECHEHLSNSPIGMILSQLHGSTIN